MQETATGKRCTSLDSRFLMAMGSADVRLVAFDIFDTLVIRTAGNAAAIYLELGRRLRSERLIECPPGVFATLRQSCETRARSHTRESGLTLVDIYQEMSGTLQIERMIPDMARIETEVEAEFLRGIPGMREKVESARSRHGRVVFVADTPLPRGFLRRQLEAMGFLTPQDGLYVTSDAGVGPGREALIRHALASEGLRPHELLHCANSSSVDPVDPGIPCHRFRHAIHHPSDKILNDCSKETKGLASMLAGAARMARLEGGHLCPDARTVWETGASVTGPIVLLYALWILSRAKMAGVKQLYFLARDAYLPFKAVKMLIEVDPRCGIEARYIYGSRHVYNLLGTERLAHDDWSRLTTHGDQPDQTIAELCESLMAERPVMKSHLATLGFARTDWDKPLTDLERDLIRDHAIGNESFNRALVSGIHRFQRLAGRYFSEEGFDPEKKVALVDSGWTTRSHAPLLRFLQKESREDPLLLCMGVVMPETAIPLSQIETFIFNRAGKQGIMRQDVFYPRAVETLLLADHGRTVSFRKHAGRVVPVFTDPENGDFMDRYYEHYKAGFLAFMRGAMPCLTEGEVHYDLSGMTERLIARFWLDPTLEEARVWSRLEWEWDPQGKIRYPLARAYRISDAWRAFVQNRFPDCQPQFWSGAARRLSSRGSKLALEKAITLRQGSECLLRMLPACAQSFISRAGRRLTRSQWPGF